MSDIRTILCPVDFSESSRHALDHAIAIARWHRARLVGLYVSNQIFTPVPGMMVGPFADPALQASTNDQLLTEVRASLEPARAAGLETTCRVEAGPVAAAIVDVARGEHADLIAMGTHGVGGFEHLVLGSVAERVLRTARCPVLTVPPRARVTSKLPFRRLLCPIDFSDPSLAALELTFSFAREAEADVTLVHVLEWPPEHEPLPNRAFNVPEYGRCREKDAATRLAALVPERASEWCRMTTRIAHGKPYREILGLAAESSADLIVMGVHGRNALDLMLFGSTTNQVVRRATCPVLTLKG